MTATWYRHLPANQGRHGVSAYPWYTRWDIPNRVAVARALVEHFDDDRVAYWSICQDSILDSLVRTERAAAERAAVETQGTLL